MGTAFADGVACPVMQDEVTGGHQAVDVADPRFDLVMLVLIGISVHFDRHTREYPCGIVALHPAEAEA